MAAGVTISAEERAYLISGIQQDFRTDGRCCSDYNYFTVETGVVNSTNGSAKVKLVSEQCDDIRVKLRPTITIECARCSSDREFQCLRFQDVKIELCLKPFH